MKKLKYYFNREKEKEKYSRLTNNLNKDNSLIQNET